jgi:glycosyltransferase involved in cell wall biosynthesis
VNACTIASCRQLAHARVLVASFREHHPDPELRFTVLLLDGTAGAAEIPGAKVRQLEELLGERTGLTVAGNPAAALDAAVLPHLLRRLLEEDGGPVAYLAPGLRVLGPLQELQRMLEHSELVLVARASPAHTGEAAAFAGQSGGGALSRRLLGVRAGTSVTGVFDAWPRWFQNGGPAVQAWFDGLPAIAAGTAVLREPGYGLDPWTLASWSPNGSREALEVAGRPARVFDFSELNPLAPERLCDAPDAVDLSSAPALAELCEREAAELLQAGWEQDVARAERLGVLGDGARMGPTMRRLLLKGLEEKRLTLSPLEEEGREAFYEYLNQPGEHGAAAGLTRLHMAIWEATAELRTAYPHLDGPDGAGFAGWLCVYGPDSEGLPPALLPPAPPDIHRDSAPNRHEREPLWGVNVAGFFTSELGLGEAARLLIAGLDACGVPALPVQALLAPPCRQGAQFTYADPDAAAFPINIVCMNGDTIAPFAREVGSSFFEGRHTIALWFWELGEFPAGWEHAWRHVDEVWVTSRHIYDAIAPAAPVPVVQVRLPVSLPRVPALSRKRLGMPPEGFLFLFVHDYHSIAARKNPAGVVEAFKRAFAPSSGAQLVVKSINAAKMPHEHDRVVLAAGDRPDITLIDEYMSVDEKNGMIAACDCYISLHRSEGFGLTVAEAMLLGKPVIATRYGGTLEFMNDANSYLVDWQPAQVGDGAYPYPPRAAWADPDLDHAATLMRKVMGDPEAARTRGELARRALLERHSPRVAGQSMQARLRTIHERRLQEGAWALNPARMPALGLEELGELIESDPPLEGQGRGAALKSSLRRHAAGLTRPMRGHQRAVDRRIALELSIIDGRLRELAHALQDQQEARFAELLAMVRGLRTELRDMRTGLAAVEELEPAPRLETLERLGRELEQHLAERRSAAQGRYY